MEEESKSSEPNAAKEAAKPDETSSAPIRKWRVLWGVLGLGCVFSLVFVLVAWRGLLTIAADLWVLEQRVPKADAIVVLGGDLQLRPSYAAHMYHRGIAPKILVSKPRLKESDRRGVTTPFYKYVFRMLKRMGVPDEDVEVFGEDVASTFDEAKALGEWAKRNPNQTVLVPTTTFHTRRAEWILTQQAPRDGLSIHVTPLPNPDYNLHNWWRNEYGLIAFQNEVVKYCLYRLKY